MIELTDEMIRDAERAYGGNVEGDMIGAIKAALAIVERDYRVTAAASARLTPRQHEVLTLAADGLTAAEIGKRLHLSWNTVRGHVANVLALYGATSTTQAVAMAIRAGDIG